MKARTIGKNEERKVLLAISSEQERRPRFALRFLANAIYCVVAILAICIASMSSWSIVALGAGCVFAGLVGGYAVSFRTFAEIGSERWSIVKPHLDMESVRARLVELDE